MLPPPDRPGLARAASAQDLPEVAVFAGDLPDARVDAIYVDASPAEARVFRAHAQRARGAATPAGVRGLLWWRNWRPRLLGAWLAGLAGHRVLEDRLGRLLCASELTWRAATGSALPDPGLPS